MLSSNRGFEKDEVTKIHRRTLSGSDPPQSPLDGTVKSPSLTETLQVLVLQ